MHNSSLTVLKMVVKEVLSLLISNKLFIFAPRNNGINYIISECYGEKWYCRTRI